MAIRQVSKIKVRSGLQTNLPQLDTGELGWALDSQRLWIGNGNVSQGAPIAGNTEILTTANLNELMPSSNTPASGIPSGTKNGTNEVFLLPVLPIPNTLIIWNNTALIPNVGYFQNGVVITFATAPQSTDNLFFQCWF